MKVILIQGHSHTTPWGQKCRQGLPFMVTDDVQLSYFRRNSRYLIDPDNCVDGATKSPVSRVSRDRATRQHFISEEQSPSSNVDKNVDELRHSFEEQKKAEQPKESQPDYKLLENSIPKLPKAIKGLSKSQLILLLKAELSDRNRKGAVQVINDLIEKKK